MTTIKDLVSVVIPSRNEPYLSNTIKDILSKVHGNIEIIVILDGWWEESEKIVDDPRVIYIHRGESRGMRNGINSAVAISKGEYIMKTDAHCLFADGFDTILKRDCGKSMVVVPRRYRLDVENWKIIEDGRPPVDYEYIDPNDLHGVRWEEKAVERKGIMIDPIISAQGSCWFTTREHFDDIEGLDEKSYGSFFLEFQELSFKTWSMGGSVVIDKNTHYAHLHKTKGRGYSLKSGEREKAQEFMKKWRDGSAWHKSKIGFDEIVKKFLPMPNWK